MKNRDFTNPIEQIWIKLYCDQLIELAQKLPVGVMRDATLLRVAHVQDLVEAWQKRNMPREER